MKDTMKPLQRPGLIVQHVMGETLIYDETCHKAFCLNAMAGSIWKQCDGRWTPDQIASALGLSYDVVMLAIESFLSDGLIEPLQPEVSAALLSRRAMAIKLGLGVGMALPIVAAIIAPRAAQAYSGCFQCTNDQPADDASQ